MKLKEQVGSLKGADGTPKMSREIVAARADIKRLEMKASKAEEDAARAKAEVTELSEQCCFKLSSYSVHVHALQCNNMSIHCTLQLVEQKDMLINNLCL